LVSSTGKRRYGHPALNGVLPEPWLPLKKGQTLANYNDNDGDNGDIRTKNGDASTQAVVLTLRRKYSVMRNDVRHIAGRIIGNRKKLTTESGHEDASPEDAIIPEADVPKPPSESSSNPWRDIGAGPSRTVLSGLNSRRLSFD
jgi:calcium permeable stress-gated cation channel